MIQQGRYYMASINRIANIIYPEFYQTPYIFAYYKLNSELKAMIEESGYKNEFIKKYNKSLRFLENLKQNCINQRKLFEKLTECKDLYSIMIFGNKNIRILFTFLDIKARKNAILLYSFEEKDDKNNSNYGYTKAIDIATDRIREIKEFLCNQ